MGCTRGGRRRCRGGRGRGSSSGRAVEAGEERLAQPARGHGSHGHCGCSAIDANAAASSAMEALKMAMATKEEARQASVCKASTPGTTKSVSY